MKVLLKKNIKNDRQMRHTKTERVILETAYSQYLVKYSLMLNIIYKTTLCVLK